MVRAIESIEGFAALIYDLLKSDRDVITACGGMTGEGKTVFLAQLQKEYCKIAGIKWGFNTMTWSRKELLKWIDGAKDSKIDGTTGLKPGQKPEYSTILCDELFGMFFKRNWYDEDQIDAITTLNMCRDRHLFLGGNIPNFFDLDTSFQSRIRFYVYIVERGRAWVFEQENNPFCTDKWNVTVNKKKFRTNKTPYSIPNFICEIHYNDFTEQEKAEYLEIRNTKRVASIDQNKSQKVEKYAKIKHQRDSLIRLIIQINNKLSKPDQITMKDLIQLTGLSKAALSLIKNTV